MVFVNKSSLVEATKESNLQLAIAILVPHDLGWPVGKPFLLGIHDPVKRPTGLREPMFVSPENILMSSSLMSWTVLMYLVLAYL